MGFFSLFCGILSFGRALHFVEVCGFFFLFVKLAINCMFIDINVEYLVFKRARYFKLLLYKIWT